MAAHRRLRQLGDLNELGNCELTLLQEKEKAPSGEVAQSAHSVEDARCSYSIHKSRLKDVSFSPLCQSTGVSLADAILTRKAIAAEAVKTTVELASELVVARDSPVDIPWSES